jgi:hypothetical protein
MLQRNFFNIVCDVIIILCHAKLLKLSIGLLIVLESGEQGIARLFDIAQQHG